VKIYPAHWSKYSNNFGDILTPVILGHYGVQVSWAGRGHAGKILAVGSILDRMLPGDIVWGTGAIPLPGGKKYIPPQGVRFLAVRGPKTRSLIEGEVPEIYGDPAILLPQVLPQTKTNEFEVGVILHEVEKDIPPVQDPKVLWIDINSGVVPVVQAINRCQVVLSSSLHGVIAAEAYGVPTVWVKATDRINGGSWKFDDYYLSTGREPVPAVPWERGLSSLVERARPFSEFNVEPLLKSLREGFLLPTG